METDGDDECRAREAVNDDELDDDRRSTRQPPPRPRRAPLASEDGRRPHEHEWGWIAFGILAAAVVVRRDRLVAAETLRRVERG